MESLKYSKEGQCHKAQEVRHAWQGCQYGATTSLDDQLHLEVHSARESVRVCNDGGVESRRQIIRRCLHVGQGKKIAMQLNRVANQLRFCIAKSLCKFLKVNYSLCVHVCLCGHVCKYYTHGYTRLVYTL